MEQTVIQKIYREFKDSRRFTLPPDFRPVENGCNTLVWLRDILATYKVEGVVVRALDDLPPLQLSAHPDITVTAQDLHRFIISDMNMVPMETRRAVLAQATSDQPAPAAWGEIIPLLSGQFQGLEEEEVREEITWTFSPVAEILWALTWVFMEREGVRPPRALRMVSGRFPYYTWLTPENIPGLWEPESPLCRWQWLALDLFEAWKTGEGPA